MMLFGVFSCDFRVLPKTETRRVKRGASSSAKVVSPMFVK